MTPNKKIILEDGEIYYGFSFGSESEKILETVFNTSLTGYQEILSDPSYTDQAVVMTYPLIGNYGMNSDDYETDVPGIGAMIVRDYNDEPSNFRSSETLGEVMKRYDITGVYGIDTRKLTRSIRNFGSRKALITDADVSDDEGLKKLKESELPRDSVKRAGAKEIKRSFSPTDRYHVAVIDCGIKKNILRSLKKRDCAYTVLPPGTPAEVIRDLKPDGILISNGPGDPNDVPQTIETVRSLIGFCPIFGICLGHQIISIAYGAKTLKLKFGHRGGNHPVKNLETGKIEITSQNHSYAVNPDSLTNTGLKITHVNLLDQTVEGVKCENDRVFGIQYHPESSPGPRDSAYLFDLFIEKMKE